MHGHQLTSLDLEVHRAAGTHLRVVCRQSHFHALGLGVHRQPAASDPNGVDTEVFVPRTRPDRARLRARSASAPTSR